MDSEEYVEFNIVIYTNLRICSGGCDPAIFHAARTIGVSLEDIDYRLSLMCDSLQRAANADLEREDIYFAFKIYSVNQKQHAQMLKEMEEMFGSCGEHFPPTSTATH